MSDTGPLTLHPGHAALIVQDMQNDVIGERGAFRDTGAPEHAASQNVIANVARLADAARTASMAVIHVHYVVEPRALGLRQNAPLFRAVKDSGALVRGSWGAAAVDAVAPRSGDHVVEKLRMNGFYGTPLDALLRGLEISTLVIAGCYTNLSIEHTARHGADAGYEIVVVSDGTSTTSDEWQHAALDYAMTNVGRVATVDEVIAAL
jgi:gluconolactonase